MGAQMRVPYLTQLILPLNNLIQTQANILHLASKPLMADQFHPYDPTPHSALLWPGLTFTG